MGTIVGPDAVARSTNLYFSISKHLRNEVVNISSINANYVISINGQIHQNKAPSSGASQATIVLVGGFDTFIHSKDPKVPRFYMTERQKVTIYNILKSLSSFTDKAEVASDIETLDLIVNATYKNYCG